MKNPKISIVIPVHNDGRFLKDAIRSVERCDGMNYEMIIVNDGSDDRETLDILRSLKKKGYKVITQKNKGPGSARNLGIAHSKSEYFLPLDADDKITPDYIRQGIEILDKNPDVGVVYGDRFLFGDKNGIGITGAFDRSRLSIETYIGICAVVRREAFDECGGYDTSPPVRDSEDWELWLNIAKKGWRFFYIPRLLYYCRLRKDSLSKTTFNTPQKKSLLRYIWKKHADFCKIPFTESNFRMHMDRHYRNKKKGDVQYAPELFMILSAPFKIISLLASVGHKDLAERALFFVKSKSFAYAGDLRRRKSPFLRIIADALEMPGRTIENFERKSK